MAAKRVGPKVRDDVALIRFSSPCQIHPWWRSSARAAQGQDRARANTLPARLGALRGAHRDRAQTLIQFLAERRPPALTSSTATATLRDPAARLAPAKRNSCRRRLGFPEEKI
jgi:single-stranded-DNA-specific exonuclease